MKKYVKQLFDLLLLFIQNIISKNDLMEFVRPILKSSVFLGQDDVSDEEFEVMMQNPEEFSLSWLDYKVMTLDFEKKCKKNRLNKLNRLSKNYENQYKKMYEFNKKKIKKLKK
ncbi:hypothetical protein IMG5_200070 [Ichthyophthirius multifiliis]|uniref:Uncharacterized protein n=1 Tax=Ichthyophthirius multifiliis TaxID=5932 RepID=G0R5P8_ICHMU|nr:hypothetical protein IMG5_200070 [Ichthyophthirius multifiliis]EGR27221.1 hypothetical protein IMG5_200070 [Ichthyophthirius multifiliis]|eukprot:XP_004024105.1 hypothetical protein IMG5_200070 [Ichthyophthirius multifiliis]